MKKIFVSTDSGFCSFMGRIDFEDKKAPKFFYSGSSCTIRFSGSFISCSLKNHRIYNVMELGFILDGREGKLKIEKNDERISILIAEGLEKDETHTLTLFKRQDATHFFELYGFEIDGEAFEPLPLPKRRIEVFGDSVSCGAVCEAHEYAEKNDPENHNGIYDNAYHSYAFITARNFGAQIHNNSQGGIALFSNTGYFHAPNCIGLEDTYDKLCYFPEYKVCDWDFSLYTPHVVIIAIGQNDPHNEGHEDNDISNPEYRGKWKTKYKEIIMDLRSKYPKAVFVLTTTVLQHDKAWDEAIEEARIELCDEKIYHNIFTRNGKATPGHPRICEQQEMAEELTCFISNLPISVWED